MMGYLEVLLEEARQESRNELEIIRARAERTDNSAADSAEAVELKRRMRTVGMLRFLLRNVLAKPLYRAGGLPMPPAVDNLIDASRELLPTARPRGELAPYLGEALYELRHGVDIVLNVAPNGCMVSTMGEVLTPSIMSADGVEGNIQTLLSAEGDVDEEILSLAVLKATGPHRYYGITTPAAAGAELSSSVAG